MSYIFPYAIPYSGESTSKPTPGVWLVRGGRSIGGVATVARIEQPNPAVVAPKSTRGRKARVNPGYPRCVKCDGATRKNGVRAGGVQMFRCVACGHQQSAGERAHAEKGRPCK